MVFAVADVPGEAFVVGDEENGLGAHEYGEEQCESVAESGEGILSEAGGADSEGGEAHDDVRDVDAGGDVGVWGDGVDVGEKHPPADQGHHGDDLGRRGHACFCGAADCEGGRGPAAPTVARMMASVL